MGVCFKWGGWGLLGEIVVRLYVLMNKFGCFIIYLNLINVREIRKVILKIVFFNLKGDLIKWVGNFLVIYFGVKYFFIVLMILIVVVFIF